MTDEQYIEKLVDAGFEQKEINQLLKIYVYTKPYDFVLQNININIDTDILRKIASFVKDEKLSQEYYNLLKHGQNYECNIIPYLLERYDTYALSILIELEAIGKDVEKLKNPKFSREQINMLSHYLEKGVKGLEEYCFNPDYSLEKMAKIISGLMFDIVLEDYINIENFDQEQCSAIAQALKQAEIDPYLVNLDIIIDNKLSAQKMLQILDLMVQNKPYWLLLNNNYSEIFCNILYNSIKKDENIELIEKYLSEKNNFNSKQANSVLQIISDLYFHESEYDYKKIFDKKNNYLKIAVYHQLVKSKETEFLDKIINYDYNISQITDLFRLYKMGINIDEIKDKNDTAMLHLYRREKELKLAGKSIDDYLKISKTEKKKAIKEQKYEVKNSYYNNQFFKMSDGGYLEVYKFEEPWDREILGTVHEDCPAFEDEINSLKDIIIETFKNMFVVSVNEEKETIDLYDISKKETIQEHIDHYAFKTYFVDALFDEEQLYNDLFDAVAEYFDCYNIITNNDSPFASPFGTIEEFVDFIPNFGDKLKVFIFGDMSETLYYVVTEKDIIEKYGKVDDETKKLAEKEFKETCECLDAYESCEVFACRKYDKNFELVNEKKEYYGPTIIDDIERDFGLIQSELGMFPDIESVQLAKKDTSLEER